MISSEKLIKIVEETGHHPLGASSWSRWSQCPGSTQLSLAIKEISSGVTAADIGTKAHELGERCLRDGVNTDEVEGDYPENMRTDVQGYVDYVRDIAQGEAIYVEQRLDLSQWIPEGMGTADAVVFIDNVCHVIDYKNGFSPVDPDDGQLKIYALGCLIATTKFGITDFQLHIYQPNNGGAKSITTTRDELLEFGETVKIKAQLCLEDDAPLIPSEKACQWCRANATCPALYNHNIGLVGEDFEVMPPEQLTDAQLHLVMSNKSLIESWLKAVEAHIFNRIEHGEPFDGWKMVEGRSQRKYASNAEEVLVKILGDDAFDRKLKGIGAVEKALGKKQFAELQITEKPQGKPVLVSEDDPRKPIAQISDDFETAKQ